MKASGQRKPAKHRTVPPVSIAAALTTTWLLLTGCGSHVTNQEVTAQTTGSIQLRTNAIGVVHLEQPAKDDDLILVLVDWGCGRIEPQSDLSYGFFTLTNQTTTVFDPMNPRFHCRVSLLDSKGNPLPRTDLGAQYGKRFDDAKPAYRSVGNGTFKEMKPYFCEAKRKPPDPDLYPNLFVFPSVDKLFEVKSAGKYKLRLELQVFRSDYQTGRFQAKRVRFPSIEYELLMEKDADQ